MTAVNLSIENCNSIERAEISITPKCLNIKYGPNGLGKSTIAKALLSKALDDGSLTGLLPFKYRSNPDGHQPSVTGAESLAPVLIFDENYVSQFVFQRDEVLKNSFEIFINTDDFKKAVEEIEGLLSGIKKSFLDNQELEQATSDLKELRDAFNVTKSGGLAKTSKGLKAFGSGNKVLNIPDNLQPFKDFIQSEQPSSWITWQAKGNSFLDLSDNCPYCSSSLKDDGKKDTAKLVAKEYDSKSVEHLSALQAVIERLGKYFEESCRSSLEQITKSKIELQPEEITFLSNLRSEIETLLTKFEGLKTISFFSLRDVEKIDEEIGKLKIDLSLLTKLTSDETKSIVAPINQQLEELVAQVGILKGKIGAHKKQIAKTIDENKKHINGFLRSAGYKYSVDIRSEGESYKMKLVHEDHAEHLESAAQHLSYGERNAFALVLFMHEAIRKQPGLVILDDPVSSFDKTKKFAIIHQLFRGKESLRDQTVLMLTHDIEPVVDMLRAVRGKFQHPKPNAFFLSRASGIVTEIKVEASDIKTFAQICSENIAHVSDEIVKCIYLRRHYEILGSHGVEYNILSSLLHGRESPTKQTDGGDVLMTQEEIAAASSSIQEQVSNFSYSTFLSLVKDLDGLKKRFSESSVGYEKLQIYRIWAELQNTDGSEKDDDIIRKFVNETFHIENEYVMQLNPHKFDVVPEYVVAECERAIA